MFVNLTTIKMPNKLIYFSISDWKADAKYVFSRDYINKTTIFSAIYTSIFFFMSTILSWIFASHYRYIYSLAGRVIIVIPLWVVHFTNEKSLRSESILTKLWTLAFIVTQMSTSVVSWEYKHLLFIFISLMSRVDWLYKHSSFHVSFCIAV